MQERQHHERYVHLPRICPSLPSSTTYSESTSKSSESYWSEPLLTILWTVIGSDTLDLSPPVQGIPFFLLPVSKKKDESSYYHPQPPCSPKGNRGLSLRMKVSQGTGEKSQPLDQRHTGPQAKQASAWLLPEGNNQKLFYSWHSYAHLLLRLVAK